MAFATPKKPLEEIHENMRFLAAMRKYSAFERALGTHIHMHIHLYNTHIQHSHQPNSTLIHAYTPLPQDTLPRPTLIMCKSNRRAGCVASVYEGVRNGMSFSALIGSSVHPWHGSGNMAAFADLVVGAMYR